MRRLLLSGVRDTQPPFLQRVLDSTFFVLIQKERRIQEKRAANAAQDPENQASHASSPLGLGRLKGVPTASFLRDYRAGPVVEPLRKLMLAND